MKKQQKIIELRRAAKLKVAEIETKIAFAHSEAAKERTKLLWERAFELEGREVSCMARFDVLAKYRAKLAGVDQHFTAMVAQLKSEIQQVKSECEQQCAAVEDDPEPEKEQRETVYCDGSEHSARIVARRIINKMPHTPTGGYLFVHIIRDDVGEYFVNISAKGEKQEDYVSVIFSRGDGKKEEDLFVEMARETFKTDDGEVEIKAVSPKSRALDAVFGGNPVEQVDNLISDTVKDGKEGGNE